MRHIEASNINKELRSLFLFFSIWSFITLCRPQDYLPLLALLRPSLTLGLMTLVVYFLNVQKRPPILENEQFKIFLFLILLIIVGVPFSYYRRASLQMAFDYISFSIIFFILFFKIGNTVEELKSLLFVYCCGASIYAIYILGFGNLTGGRIAFGSFDPNDTAFFVINFVAFNLLFISKEYNLFKRIIVVINIFIGLIVLFKTGSRGGFIACVALFMYLLFFKTKTVNISLIKKAILCALAFVFLWSFSENAARYKTILDMSEDYNLTAETGRVAIWKIGMRMMLENPLTGVGIGRFNEGVGRDRQERGLPSAKWQAPHNSFVQIGAEIGVIGLILYTLLTCNVFIITGRLIKNIQSQDLIKISEMVRAGFIGYNVCAMFLSMAYSPYWLFYIALSAKLLRMLQEEQTRYDEIENQSRLYPNSDHIWRSRKSQSELPAHRR